MKTVTKLLLPYPPETAPYFCYSSQQHDVSEIIFLFIASNLSPSILFPGTPPPSYHQTVLVKVTNGHIIAEPKINS